MTDRTLHNIRDGLAEAFTNIEFEETDETLVIRLKKMENKGIQTKLKPTPALS